MNFPLLPDDSPVPPADQAGGSIDALLAAARAWPKACAWVWYREGEPLHRAAQGGAFCQWPASLAKRDFDGFCRAEGLHRWATGEGEHALGWLLAARSEAHNPQLAQLASDLGVRVQSEALARAQITQRVLYEITYLASSTRDRAEFLEGVHRQLGDADRRRKLLLGAV